MSDALVDEFFSNGLVQWRNGLAGNQKGGQVEQIQENLIPITARKREWCGSMIWSTEEQVSQLPESGAKILIAGWAAGAELLGANHALHHDHVIVWKRLQ